MIQTPALRSRWATLKSDLQAGWRAIALDPLLRLVVIQATIGATLLLVLLSLVPGLVTRHLGLATEDAALLMTPGGLGYVLGALLLGRAELRLSLPAWITLGLVSLGAAISAMGLAVALAGAQALALIVPLIAVTGLGLAMVIIPARVILQERPHPTVRGRVIAVQLALANAAAVLPILLGGTLADRLGIPIIVTCLGLLSIVAGVFGLRQAPATRLDERR